MKRGTSVMVAAVGASVLVGGCGREPLAGPPELRLGKDLCAECGMIVNEEASSCGLLIEREGRREHVVFDDIGCMLDYEAGHEGEFTPIQAFVHDRDERAWMKAEEALFISAPRELLRTPMGSGIAAYRTRAQAEAASGKFGGKIVELGALAGERRAASGERHAESGGAH